MRKALAAVIAAAAIVLVLAAPALAKDPFEPLVTTEDASTNTTTTTGSDGQPAVIGVPGNATNDSMPNTGSDVASWLVLSYGLVVVGGAAYVLSRTLRPTSI